VRGYPGNRSRLTAASSLPPAPAGTRHQARAIRAEDEPTQLDYIGGPNEEPINSRSIESYERAAAGGVTGMLGGANLEAIYES
jgi:hypothetical protein